MPKSSVNWIQSRSGKQLRAALPSYNRYDIHDIAFSLANLCRYTGHCEFFSVAQHSVLVSKRAEQIAAEGGLPAEYRLYVARWGLLHDASESLLNDIASPFKRQRDLDGYRRVEGRIMGSIATWAGLGTEEPYEVHEADLDMLATEAHSLMWPLHPDWEKDWPEINTRKLPFEIEPLLPDQARALFAARFNELFPNGIK